MSITIRSSTATSSYNSSTHTLTINTPAGMVAGDALLIFLMAQAEYAGPDEGSSFPFGVAEAVPTFYDTTGFNSALAPNSSACWWADASNDVTFPGWELKPTSGTVERHWTAAAIYSDTAHSGFIPYVSWSGLARTVDGTEPSSYSFKILGTVPANARHIYTAFALCLSPYTRFSGAFNLLLPESGALSTPTPTFPNDDLWTQFGGTFVHISNAFSGNASPSNMRLSEADTTHPNAQTTSTDDLVLLIMLYQGRPDWGTSSSNDTAQGFTYVTGAIATPSPNPPTNLLNQRLTLAEQLSGFTTGASIWSSNSGTLALNAASTPVTVSVDQPYRDFANAHGGLALTGTMSDYSPHSGGNNLPSLQVLGDDGTWREFARFFDLFNESAGPQNYNRTPVSVPGLVVGSSLQFRVNNNHDVGGSGFSPRSWTGLTLNLLEPTYAPPWSFRQQIAYTQYENINFSPVQFSLTRPPNLPFRPNASAPHNGFYTYGLLAEIRFVTPPPPPPGALHSWIAVIG